VLFRVRLPGVPKGIPASQLGKGGLRKLANVFFAASSERRLLIMLELMKRPETRFTELLEVGVNPKLVADCLQPLVRQGLVVHERGGTYSPSNKGTLVITALTAFMATLLAAAEGEDS
ncbi:MAG: hypothetical protein HY297_03725, partial [Thaumarchaeota archaeon]|nr:hypothetical protein [Nitrososphaerota archaeon]